jgi:hypothetical protein
VIRIANQGIDICYHEDVSARVGECSTDEQEPWIK